jgi:hypothetical protein
MSAISRIQEADLEHLIEPIFKFETYENVNQSEIKGEPVMETREVVEVRFAGDRNYAPVLPADSVYRREGHRQVTYAERWSKRYAEFVQGAAQTASGTPLEKLMPYGITGSQLSLCRALKVYSIEALYNMDGANLKNLGIHTNELKRMANEYMTDRAKGSETLQELEALKKELAEIRLAKPIPEEQFDGMTPQDIDAFSNLSDDELKAYIKDKTGTGVRGQPSRDTLLSMARDAA